MNDQHDPLISNRMLFVLFAPKWVRRTMLIIISIFTFFYFMFLWRSGVGAQIYQSNFIPMGHSIHNLIFGSGTDGGLFELLRFCITGKCTNPHGCIGSP